MKANKRKDSTFKGISYLVFIIFLSSCSYEFYQSESSYPLAGSLKKIYTLPDSINETSGLETSGKTLLTHNDSGGEAVVYSLDKNGNIHTKLQMEATNNTDWEDIAMDDSYCYIADVGNNFGNRDTLKILRFPNSVFESGWSLVEPEIIEYSYDEETSFSSSGWYSHDCEAMLAYNDSLYLFRKDWVKGETSVYVLPAIPGYYALKRHSSYEVNAQITGADILPVKKEVVLVGYRNFMPVLIRYTFKESPAFIEKGGKARIYPLHIGTQVEGVCYDEEGRILVSSEKRLYKQAVYEVGQKPGN